MAEVIVDFVCQKLQNALNGPVKDVLLEEGQFLYGVSDKVAGVQQELVRIKSFLKDADSRSTSEEEVRNWVEDVRNVAYSIEDAVDNFQAEVDWINYKEPGFMNSMKRFVKKPMLRPALETLGTKIDVAEAIKKKTESAIRMGVKSLDDGSLGISRVPIERHPELGEMEMKVVGFESDKANIIGRLLDEQTLRSVVSIVGVRGIGKTTLAETVYNSAEVKDRFEILIWLSVSEEYNLIDLLKQMLENLQQVNQRDYHELTEEDLMNEIRISMREKKYLVVVDDIGDEILLWEQLQKAFPDVSNGSRVLITSRFDNVANKADPNPHQLKYLNEEQSRKLLLQKAFLTSDSNEACPQDLEKLASEFARKCDGLPLKLVVLGGLLSRKSKDYPTWERLMHTMDGVTDGNSCFDSIITSYKHLPLHLKSCFMSLSVFPENYEINARSLISYWSIGGFILQDGSGTMEEKANGYLEELVQRCMLVQVPEKTSAGIIDRYRVHALLRNIAVHEAKEKNFITIFRNQEDNQKENARQASFHYCAPKAQSISTKNKDVKYYTGANVRALMFFGMTLPIHSQMRLLKVLIAYRTSVIFYYGKHTWLENLISLRHLEFRKCKLEGDTLPEKIDCLHCLEYLDLTGTKIVDLPKSIKDNEELILEPENLRASSN